HSRQLSYAEMAHRCRRCHFFKCSGHRKLSAAQRCRSRSHACDGRDRNTQCRNRSKPASEFFCGLCLKTACDHQAKNYRLLRPHNCTPWKNVPKIGLRIHAVGRKIMRECERSYLKKIVKSDDSCTSTPRIGKVGRCLTQNFPTFPILGFEVQESS